MGRIVPDANPSWSGRIDHGANRLWGEMSMGRIDPDSNPCWGESSMGRIVQRVGETSMGRNVQWVKRLETTSIMHHFRDNDVYLQTGNDVMVISPLGGAVHNSR